MQAKAILIAILCILVAVVSIQNAEVVDVRFLVWTFEVSRVLLILVSFAIGLAMGFLLSLKKKKPKEVKKPNPNLDMP